MGHRIQNVDALATSALREDALAIAEAGYAAIDADSVFARKLRIERDVLCIDSRNYPLAGRNIYFAGVGKCAFAGARAVEKLLGDRLTGGIAFGVSPLETPLAKVETHIGTHPLPSEVNVQATERMIEFLSGRTESDLVLMLISGGGSALLCLNKPPCDDDLP